MEVPQEDTPVKQSGDTTPTTTERVVITVKTITAKVFLNRPADQLVPERYLRKAKRLVTARPKPWIFRNGSEDGREADLGAWSQIDVGYRGVFHTLWKSPSFAEDLWNGGSENCQEMLDRSSPAAQGHVIYTLLDEVGKVLNIRRSMSRGQGVFCLTPRLLYSHIEYWTGFRQKHRDGPQTDGFLTLEFRPQLGCHLIAPVSTTMQEESLESSLEGKFKLILGQLLHFVRPLHLPGDKLPDQEVFLIGLHGSKFHLMRGYFPGQKLSSLWCRRELDPTCGFPTAASLASETADLWPSLFPDSPDETQAQDRGTDDADVDIVEPKQGPHTHEDSGRSDTPPSMARLEQCLDFLRHQSLDYEPDVSTFRVLATYQYDLWLNEEFTAAVQILVALHMYLLSGRAQCGTLQETFHHHPYNEDGAESDSPEDSDDELEAALQERARKAQTEFERREEELRQEEMITMQAIAYAQQMRESMRDDPNSQDDNIASTSDSAREWWDFEWDDFASVGVSPGDDGKGDDNSEGHEEGHGESTGDANADGDDNGDEDLDMIGSMEL